MSEPTPDEAPKPSSRQQQPQPPAEPAATPPPAPSPPDEEAPSAGSPTNAPPTILTRLRKQYEQAGEDDRETIPIAPGRFDGNLAARYRRLDWTLIRKKARAAHKRGESEESELQYAAEIITRACEMIVIRPEDGGDFVPLHEEVARWKDGAPVRFDSRLAEIFGIDSVEPTVICRMLFKNPQALNDHFVDLDAWMKENRAGDEDDEIDEDDEEGRLPPT